MSKYAKKDRLAEGIFAIFMLTWFVTRLGIYPFYCLIPRSQLPVHISSRILDVGGIANYPSNSSRVLTYFVVKVVVNIFTSKRRKEINEVAQSLEARSARRRGYSSQKDTPMLSSTSNLN
ncbi:Ceramide synthase 5 [Orchesella cincta]|uniref:Ceramide synthase 5 n=1 Tax=Orchesella cincta TaxID=48709 RepID=A0A1D2M0Q6_ORCCI|nr:Ceramide synthase 5 [Orchesella cincta]